MAIPTWVVGDRNPSITENIVDDSGVAVDLTSATVNFKGRAFGGTALLVSGTAVIVAPATAGNVRYDWTAADAASGILSAPNKALVWWEVTIGGKLQNVSEAPIAVRAHAPLNAYVELEEFKQTLELAGQTYPESDAQIALVAASRGIEEALDRRFYLDTADATRYYSPENPYELGIDDLAAGASVSVDRSGDGSYEETWTRGSEYEFAPVNAALDGKPYTSIQVLAGTSRYGRFPCLYPNSVKVVARFGWPAVPEGVKTLTTLIARRLMIRTREAPMGLLAFGMDGATVRATQFASDPEYQFLIEGLGRAKLLV
jgi:hypothetical protein